jgi:hypothetical protein
MKKLLKSVALSFFIALPLCLTAENIETSPLKIEEGCCGNHTHTNHPKASYQLSDFKGEFRIYSNSVGGIDVTQFTVAPNGYSTSTVGQTSISKNGTGIVNILSVFQYRGPIGFPGSFVTFDLTNLNIVLTLTDAEHGIGTVLIENYPSAGSNLNGTFTAIKKKGRVDNFVINVTGYSGTTPSVTTGANLIFVERQ